MGTILIDLTTPNKDCGKCRQNELRDEPCYRLGGVVGSRLVLTSNR